jgi:hypothetical protein
MRAVDHPRKGNQNAKDAKNAKKMNRLTVGGVSLWKE